MVFDETPNLRSHFCAIPAHDEDLANGPIRYVSSLLITVKESAVDASFQPGLKARFDPSESSISLVVYREHIRYAICQQQKTSSSTIRLQKESHLPVEVLP